MSRAMHLPETATLVRAMVEADLARPAMVDAMLAGLDGVVGAKIDPGGMPLPRLQTIVARLNTHRDARHLRQLLDHALALAVDTDAEEPIREALSRLPPSDADGTSEGGRTPRASPPGAGAIATGVADERAMPSIRRLSAGRFALLLAALMVVGGGVLLGAQMPAGVLSGLWQTCEDDDGDGYFSSVAGNCSGEVDCDDADPQAYPGAPERLNGKRDDCRRPAGHTEWLTIPPSEEELRSKTPQVGAIIGGFEKHWLHRVFPVGRPAAAGPRPFLVTSQVNDALEPGHDGAYLYHEAPAGIVEVGIGAIHVTAAGDGSGREGQFGVRDEITYAVPCETGFMIGNPTGGGEAYIVEGMPEQDIDLFAHEEAERLLGDPLGGEFGASLLCPDTGQRNRVRHVVSAKTHNRQTGRVYVWFDEGVPDIGGSSVNRVAELYAENIPTKDDSDGIIREGGQLGGALAHWRHDTGETLAIAAPGFPSDGANAAGRVYLLPAAKLRAGERSVHLDAKQLTTEGEAHLGHALVTGNLDGKGKHELIVSAPRKDGVGVVYILPSSHPLRAGTDDLDGAKWKIRGQQGDSLGYSLAVGDINGDGIADLVMGSPGPRPSQRGRVYVLFGQEELDWSVLHMPQDADIVIEGPNATDFGRFVAAFDADGCRGDDLWVGAMSFGGDGQPGYRLGGAVFLVPSDYHRAECEEKSSARTPATPANVRCATWWGAARRRGYGSCEIGWSG